MVIMGDLEEQFNNNRVKILFSNKLNWLYVWFVWDRESSIEGEKTSIQKFYITRDYTCAG